MAETLKITILGCGSSGGVPRIGGDWGSCDPNEKKNIRTRCSLLIEKTSKEGKTSVLIDTSPDMRQQLINAKVINLDAVLYTHDHADQTGGIDDLRAFALRNRKRVPVYLDKETSKRLIPRFDYCFKDGEKSGYPAILEENRIELFKEFVISGSGGEISFLPFLQKHGNIDSIGFKFNNIAYSSDVVGFHDKSLKYLYNLDYWIIDALRHLPHPTHTHLDQTLKWIKKYKTKKAYLTNMHIDLDYNYLLENLPNNVLPSYDSLNFKIEV